MFLEEKGGVCGVLLLTIESPAVKRAIYTRDLCVCVCVCCESIVVGVAVIVVVFRSEKSWSADEEEA